MEYHSRMASEDDDDGWMDLQQEPQQNRTVSEFGDFRAELWGTQSTDGAGLRFKVHQLQSELGRKVNWALRTGVAVVLACLYATNRDIQTAKWQSATVFSCVLGIGAVSGPSLGSTLHHAWDIWAGSALGGLASVVVNELARYIRPRWVQITTEIVLFLSLTFWVTSRKMGIGFKRCAVGVFICGTINMSVSGYAHTFYFPWTVVVPCTVGPLVAVLSMILPCPCLAVTELRHRLAFQALIERAVLCEQYEALSNSTVSAVTTADQLGETIRDDFARMKELLSPARLELIFFPAAHARLERIVSICQLRLQNIRAMQSTLRNGPTRISETHRRFHNLTAKHWRCALKSLAALNDEVVAAEQQRRPISPELVVDARNAQANLMRACEEARRQVMHKVGSQFPGPEPGEDFGTEHCRRLAQHYFFDKMIGATCQHCEEDVAAHEAYPRAAARSLRHCLEQLVAMPDLPEMKQAFKKTFTMAILLAFPYTPRLREHNPQYIWSLLGAAFVFSDYVGSAVVTGMHRMVGTLMGGVFALICFDVIGYSEVACTLVLFVWVVFWSMGRGSPTYGYLCVVTAFSAAIMFIGSLESQNDDRFEGSDIMLWRMKQISTGTMVYVIVEVLLWPNSARRTLSLQQDQIVEAIRDGLSEAVEPYTRQPSSDSACSTDSADSDASQVKPTIGSGHSAAVKEGVALVASSNASLGPADNEPMLTRRPFPRASYERALRTESRLLRIISSLHGAVRSVPLDQLSSESPEALALISDYIAAAEETLSASLVRVTSKRAKLRPFAAIPFSYDPTELIVEGQMGSMPSMWASAAVGAAAMLSIRAHGSVLRAGIARYLERVTDIPEPTSTGFGVFTIFFCLLRCSSLIEELGERLRPIHSESAKFTMF
ncbi:unnamed protein product [Prorocentrum cordatum]|uniref:Integral membrane bound transporter domain-containing protein n=1 Tax=Prorocentrum cordatum TaxID=2364126 RepID=A0ABN9VB93_9DINO|nr:unnamed protein product [Polarella glacialis]